MRSSNQLVIASALLLLLASGSRALAQPALPPTPAPAPDATSVPTQPTDAPPADSAAAESSPSTFTLGGYVEAYYQWSFNDPANGLTNFRGFDNRHNTFTLSNVALDALWDRDALFGRLTLQYGPTPATYYLAEPSLPGAGGANASSADVWKALQQAYAGYRFDVGRGLTVTAGLFLSPIGPESIAARDNWSWSRSNLFFGLPFYHAGVRAAYPLSERMTTTFAAYNGWNSVTDNNDEKSVSAQLTFTRPDLVVSALYFGGIERPPGAAEGRAWRHLLDTHATWHVSPRLSLLGHASAGLEPNDFGTSRWIAGALYARYQLRETLFLAGRGDAFVEHVAEDSGGQASAIFWPVPWVASGTATLDYRPHPRASFRLELRHDRADGDMFFGEDVTGDGTTTPFVADRDAQTTATLGATTWF